MKKIETLLLEDNPFGLRYHDLANWVGRMYVSPRASFRDLLKREELQRAGVYLLIGEDEDTGRLAVYIGEADKLSSRLPSHTQKDFWTNILVFIAKDESLDKASVRYIESVLCQKAVQDKQCDLKNAVSPSVKNMSEANKAVMDEFIETIVFMLSVMGFKIVRHEMQVVEKKYPLLICSQGNITATGRETDEGFVVHQNSLAKKDPAPSWQKTGLSLREKLLEAGVLAAVPEDDSRLVFTQDYVFTSPSSASGMVLGRSSNGRWEWMTGDGRHLKDIQEN